MTPQYRIPNAASPTPVSFVGPMFVRRMTVERTGDPFRCSDAIARSEAGRLDLSMPNYRALAYDAPPGFDAFQQFLDMFDTLRDFFDCAQSQFSRQWR